MGNYLPSTSEERRAMLSEIGCSSIDDLYANVPADVRIDALDIPGGLSEMQLTRKMTSIARKNTVFDSIFRGAGAYHRFIPALVKTVASKERFVTAYTPYQAEISQGVLQSIFEYQSMVCELTGMDVSNASLYDGAEAAAEAIFMCVGKKRNKVVISETVHPHTIETVKTYAHSRSVGVEVVPACNGVTDLEAFKAALDETCACTIVQQPNFFGNLEDAATLVAASHDAKAKSILSVEPISLGVLASPGELGADICVAEGQSLGLPLSFGGPYLGIIACTENMMRKLPGRIVGETHDDDGNRAFVLTLQAREQHIRREKASSNVCSNEALCALTAGAYMAAMGPKGIAEAAKQSYTNAHYLASRLCEIDGIDLAFDTPFFNEFLTTYSGDFEKLERTLADKGILCGLQVEGGILWCATEMNSKDDIDALVSAVREVA
ncbi:MAG: aminomethyl-transferring glycine dehydrogenase subunit GcvPA [Eggerthellaceae bacterium]|jgi:glycine dehydrogenase subunit 1